MERLVAWLEKEIEALAFARNNTSETSCGNCENIFYDGQSKGRLLAFELCLEKIKIEGLD
jgi:hypothetical protein